MMPVVPIIVKNARMDIREREFDAQILGRLDVLDRFDIELKQNEKKDLCKWV